MLVLAMQFSRSGALLKNAGVTARWLHAAPADREESGLEAAPSKRNSDDR
jgi:hypothetical protein